MFENEGEIWDVGGWNWYLPYNAAPGDRIEVFIEADQMEPVPVIGQATIIGIKPIVRDPYGTTLAEPSLGPKPEDHDYGFRYAFFAASDGQYKIRVENVEARMFRTRFTVRWIVHPKE